MVLRVHLNLATEFIRIIHGELVVHPIVQAPAKIGGAQQLRAVVVQLGQYQIGSDGKGVVGSGDDRGATLKARLIALRIHRKVNGSGDAQYHKVALLVHDQTMRLLIA